MNAHNKSIRPLIVAEHASTRFGGEAFIPYHYFKSLLELGVDAHLLVHERTKQELYHAFPHDLERLHFVHDSLVNIWCHKVGKLMPDRLAVFTLGAVSHMETQIRQRRAARLLVHTHGFHLVHQPIPVSPKQPSMMFGLSVPVIIGPMNGGMDYPANYNTVGGVERVIISILRWSAAFWNAILRGKRSAALILVANKRTYDALPAGLKSKKVLELVENGADLDRFRTGSSEIDAAERDGLNVIFVGTLIDWKRVDLLISAAKSLIGRIKFQVHVVGDGPMRSELEKQVRVASLTELVQFHGWRPQAQVAELLRDSDVMVHPSMRECGGAVVLEAMASGIPVIAANWGGPADYLDEQTGVLISPGTPETFVKELANAMLWMAQNPEARRQMGQAARERVQSLYDWRVKATALLKIYNEVVGTKQHVVINQRCSHPLPYEA